MMFHAQFDKRIGYKARVDATPAFLGEKRFICLDWRRSPYSFKLLLQLDKYRSDLRSKSLNLIHVLIHVAYNLWDRRVEGGDHRDEDVTPEFFPSRSIKGLNEHSLPHLSGETPHDKDLILLAIKASPMGGICGVNCSAVKIAIGRARFSLKGSEMTTAIPCLGELIPCSAA
jgi:hypothetical protein